MRLWRLVILALGGLRRTPLRVGLTVLGVTVGSGALVSMVAFALGIQRMAEAPFEMLGLLNNIEVSPGPGGHDGARTLDDAAIDELAALPGVAAAYPNIRAAGVKLFNGEKAASATAVGVATHVPMLGEVEDLLLAGHFFDSGEKPEALLSVVLLRDLGFESPQQAVGAVLKLEANGLSPTDAETFAYERRDFAVTVIGVYGMPGMVPGFGHRGVLVPVGLMKEIPGIRASSAMARLRSGKSAVGAGYEKAIVRVEHFADLLPLEERIRAMGFETRTLLERLDNMRTFFVFMDAALAAVGAVALVVAALGVVNTLLMSVLERYQEIGIYKAVGASDGDLVTLFLAEAGIVGLLGGLGGLLLGWAVAWGLATAVNIYAQSHGVTRHFDIFSFPLWLLVATVVFSVVVSVVAGVYPARRAARLDPIRALRHD